MKNWRSIALFCIPILLVLIACEKEKDPRSPYLGEFQFRRIIYAWNQTDTSLRVNRDTSYFTGRVESMDGIGNVDNVRIICGNGE